MPPRELQEAEVIEAICQRYHVTPSVAWQEPAWVLRHMTILNLAHGDAIPADEFGAGGTATADAALAGLMVSL